MTIGHLKFGHDFSDGRSWSVGIDGGRKDGRDFILTQGEYLVRVTHERLVQRFTSKIAMTDRVQVVCWGLGGV